MERPRRILLVFVDGFGWGQADPGRNPVLTYGGRLLRVAGPDGAAGEHVRGGYARAIDAVLGVPGLPQSATGQTTLFTGQNAQGRLGKHLTGFPNDLLREILLEHSLLRQVRQLGRTAVFANAYRPRFFELPRERQLRLSATTVATLAADLRFRDLDDLAGGRAVYQEFTNRELRERGFDVPERTPGEAGRNLARVVLEHDLTLYEFFRTDRAGHRQDRVAAETELRDLDTFLGATLDAVAEAERAGAGTTLVALTSDHGNIEDLATQRHTTHPVPLIAWGPGAAELTRDVTRLCDVTPWLIERLGRVGAAGP
jgi:hypothetical protein